MQYQVENAACDWILRTTQDAPLQASTHVDELPCNTPDPHLVGTLKLDAEFGILFSSGTTGKPKGARLLWKNIYASAQGSAQLFHSIFQHWKQAKNPLHIFFDFVFVFT